MYKSITGPVLPGPSYVSPLSGVSCVWYRLMVEVWQAGKDSHHRDTVLLSKTRTPFWVLDESGPVQISLELLRGMDLADMTETVSAKQAPTPDDAPLLHLLVDKGLVPESALGRRPHLFDHLVWETTEAMLIPGQRVEIQGDFRVSRGQPIMRRGFSGASVRIIDT